MSPLMIYFGIFFLVFAFVVWLSIEDETEIARIRARRKAASEAKIE